MSLDPRIGKLNSGRFYCFPDGNGKPEFVGTLAAVESVLGLRSVLPATANLNQQVSRDRLWTVRLTFQYPAWDEDNGIEWPDILARSKAEANAMARRQASNDGHLCTGKGQYVFTATEQKDDHG